MMLVLFCEQFFYLLQMDEMKAKKLTMAAKSLTIAPINSRLNVVVRSPTPFELGQSGC